MIAMPLVRQKLEYAIMHGHAQEEQKDMDKSLPMLAFDEAGSHPGIAEMSRETWPHTRSSRLGRFMGAML